MSRTVKFTVSVPGPLFKAHRVPAPQGRKVEERDRSGSGPGHGFEGRNGSPAGRGPDFTSARTRPTTGRGRPVQEITDAAERRRRAIAAAGRFRSGTSDLSANHDSYLEEAYTAIAGSGRRVRNGIETKAMKVFVDTSALLAVLDAGDLKHSAAEASWEGLLGGETELVTHNYVLVETSALVLRRFGLAALRVFETDIVPVLRVVWVTPEVHEAAVGAHLTAGAAGLEPRRLRELRDHAAGRPSLGFRLRLSLRRIRLQASSWDSRLSPRRTLTIKRLINKILRPCSEA